MATLEGPSGYRNTISLPSVPLLVTYILPFTKLVSLVDLSWVGLAQMILLSDGDRLYGILLAWLVIFILHDNGVGALFAVQLLSFGKHSLVKLIS